MKRSIKWVIESPACLANQILEQRECLYKQSQEIKDCLSGDLLTHLLAFEWYDEEHGIFINQNSLGFAVEIYPLAGCKGHSSKRDSSFV